MLALGTLVTLLAMIPPAPASGAHIPCPNGPEATIVTTARSCPALEVSGQIGPDGADIEPVFSTSVEPSELVRFGRGDALLSGFAADGRPIFILPLQAEGPFHFYIALAPQAMQAL